MNPKVVSNSPRKRNFKNVFFGLLPQLVFAFLVSGCGITAGPSLLAKLPSPSPSISPTPLPLAFGVFSASDVVIGQSSFTTAGSGTGNSALSSPKGNPVVFNGRLLLPDTNNVRILSFNSVPTTNGATADLSIDLLMNATVGTVLSGWHTPQSLVVSLASSLLGISNFGDDSIGFMGWNTVPTSSVFPDFSQDTSTLGPFNANLLGTTPEDIAVVGNKLVITDSGNNRVLIWNSVPIGHNTPANLVLGQVDFTGVGSGSGAFTSSGPYMNHPTGIWSDGTMLLISDQGNNRILGWKSFPTSNTAPDFVLGQVDFTGNSSTTTALGLNAPTFLTAFQNQLYVCDTGNNRVLVWNSIPNTNHVAADLVIGQGDFTHGAANDDAQSGSTGGAPTARTLSGPAGLYISLRKLFVMDTGNNRVLIYNSTQ